MTGRKVKSPKNIGRVTRRQAAKAVNVVNLTVHKNNQIQRARKSSRRVLVGAAKDMANTECVAGFYLVSWDERGVNYQDRLHDPKGSVSLSALPSFIEGCARRMITDIDGGR